MKKVILFLLIILASLAGFYPADTAFIAAENHSHPANYEIQIPLPEHPRPDFERPDWINLNGEWQFKFDSANAGIDRQWFGEKNEYPDRITVPFSWGSNLSGIEDKADIGWYKKMIRVPSSWKGKRIFLVIGASDWLSKAWLDGNYIGEFQGGYSQFEFELTDHVSHDTPQDIVIRVDDSPHAFKLEGKQGYGNVRGIWQTPYLEARGKNFIEYIHFTPDIDRELVTVEGRLAARPESGASLLLAINENRANKKLVDQKLNPESRDFSFSVPIDDPRLWSIDDPYLYSATAELVSGKTSVDKVSTYFGMRKIGTMKLPGTDYMYVSLNNKPVYLKMTLDQAYHPDGFYTWPSDEFMRDEIIRSKKLGLNCNRIHVKIDLPRKLYWADRLGLLIMADVPNSWGEPDALMKKESETAMEKMIHRDYNHPSVFSWILFNETWGLFTKTDSGRLYLPQTQEWVAEMYRKAKALDNTRLVEDNSACNYDHVMTDINTWHAYLPGYGWEKMLDEFTGKTFPGSGFNFAKGYLQTNQPMLNSECGNVWGYEGSTGDIDWSWDYHIMMNQFRMHPKVAGWLYTEHHDVINEWNGYYRFDRSEKYPGFEELAEGMMLADLHSDIYLVPGSDLCTDQFPGAEVSVPLWISTMTDRVPAENAVIHARMKWWNELGVPFTDDLGTQVAPIKSWALTDAGTWKIKLPDTEGLAILSFRVEDPSGNAIHRNFLTFNITDSKENSLFDVTDPSGKFKVLSFGPAAPASQDWSVKQWISMNGKKLNGAGTGYFEYRVDIPSDIVLSDIIEATFRAELSAKELFGKDVGDSKMEGDYMRGKGTFDPGRNPNAYPMTDEKKFPSIVTISVNGRVIGTQYLPDDPADHRGILSWHSQLKDRKLRDAGSYGYLVSLSIPTDVLADAIRRRMFTIRLEANQIGGGLAVYGRNSGRYPLDPSFIFRMK